MAFVKVKIPRTSQPQDTCGIDWHNPLTKGLTLCLLPDTGFINLVDGKKLGSSVTQPTVAGKQGKAIQINQTVVPNEYLLYTVPPSLTDATIFTQTSALGSDSVQPWRTNATEYDFIPYQALSNGIYANTFATSRYISGVPFPSTSNLSSYSICATGGAAANSHALYIDGKVVGSTNSAFSCFSEIELGRSYFGASAIGSFLYLFWGRVLSAKEIKSISENPWQVFEDEELTIWIPDSTSTPADNLTSKNITFGAATVSTSSVGQRHVLASKSVNLLAATITPPNISQIHQLVGKSVSTDALTVSKPILTYVPTTVNLVSRSISLSAATISTPVVGQVHVLSGKSANLSSVTITPSTIYQVHQLTGKSISTDAFTVTKPALSYVPTIVTLTGKNISLSSVAIPYPAVGQVHALISKSVSTGSVAVGTSALNQVHTLVGKGVTLSNAIVTSPIISQVHALSGKVIDTGEVNITKPVLVSVFGIDNLIARSIALEALQIAKPSVEHIHLLIGLDCNLDALSVAKSALQQMHILQVQPITLSQVVISKPELTSLANTDVLYPKDITLGALTVSNPSVNQVHVLIGKSLVTGSLSVVKPLLGQVHGLAPKDINLGSWKITKPILIIGGTTEVYVDEILSDVVDDKVIVLLQDEVIQVNILSETI